MKLQEYIRHIADRLDRSTLCYGHGTSNPLEEAFYIVFATLEISFAEMDSLDRTLETEEISKLNGLVQLRIDQQRPSAYLVGKAWFAGHEFFCDERALIPRSPIAELIRGDFQPLLKQPAYKILDMCTGGGCIGIATALQWPECQVDLVDISAEALSLAEKNIVLHSLGDRVRVLNSNLFEVIDASYDLIIANPPYVSSEEYADLPAEFSHEPALGLISDDEGLQIPLQILREAVDYLSDSGLLVMELGYSHEALSQRLSHLPLLWLDFEQGGEGVLAFTAKQLQQYREQFN